MWAMVTFTSARAIFSALATGLRESLKLGTPTARNRPRFGSSLLSCVILWFVYCLSLRLPPISPPRMCWIRSTGFRHCIFNMRMLAVVAQTKFHITMSPGSHRCAKNTRNIDKMKHTGRECHVITPRWVISASADA